MVSVNFKADAEASVTFFTMEVSFFNDADLEDLVAEDDDTSDPDEEEAGDALFSSFDETEADIPFPPEPAPSPGLEVEKDRPLKLTSTTSNGENGDAMTMAGENAR